MRFAAFYSSLSRSLGDAIQTVAAMRFLPRVDVYVDRDNLHEYSDGPPIFYIANGWYTNNASCFPPPVNLKPFYISFHRSQFLPATLTVYEHLKRFEPIGARDEYTLSWLNQLGVKAYLSGCLTLTLDRPNIPRSDVILLVDVYPQYMDYIPQKLRDEAISFTHYHEDPLEPCQIREAAQHKLDSYAIAKLVITSRLHVALPCLTFETPVVFLMDLTDPRISGTCQGWQPQSVGKAIDWDPAPIDLKEQRERMVQLCVAAVQESETEN
jgi:hypothetical protein